ncbi:hypothetical protein FXO37_26522 [Capsicum annuum]|nr:hypothetical protein FXO37_26522 [Capsicum annuum]
MKPSLFFTDKARNLSSRIYIPCHQTELVLTSSQGYLKDVVLIDQSERFVFKPMLYELLSGELEAWEIAPQFSDLLANTDVRFFKDRVKCLYPYDHLETNAPTAGTVQLESGLLIEYDWYARLHSNLT